MKKEFAMLFKKRYIYLIIMSVLMLTFMLIGYTEVKNVALIVPYIVGAVAIAVASRFVIKKMDYSR